jgi:hypothetical protein
MFKVPSDPDNPTYDHTFTVGFMQWLTSSAADRAEWKRRKNAAIPTSRSVQYAKGKADEAAAKAQEARDRKENRD